MRRNFKLTELMLVAGVIVGLLCFVGGVAQAYESLGVGAESLIGGDLTDPDDDGDPEFDEGYDAIFDSNEEPGFGGGEFSFNVFDNLVGGGNDKWCCGPGGGIPEEGLWINAEFDQPYVLTNFTVSSANDTPDRDPISWAVQGSNDGDSFTDIYVFDDESPWFDRLEVIEFSTEYDDFPAQTAGYSTFRFVTYDTLLNPDGAYYQVSEIEYFGQPGAGGTGLQAGDANQDKEFNQLDLVQVQIAAKYLTGAAATWGEGDWDGAPGGAVGSPPAGDGVFSQLDIIAALNGGWYLKGPYPAINQGGMIGDGQTSITYNVATGEVGVDAPAGIELTSVNIDSAAGIFTGEAAQNLGGSFDNDADTNIFKATFGSSFGSLSFGMVAQAGLSEEVVAGDLTVVGSLAGGGDLGAVDLVYIPEPSSLALLSLALAGAVMIRGRRRA